MHQGSCLSCMRKAVKKRNLQWTVDLCWAAQQSLGQGGCSGHTELLALAAIPGCWGEKWAPTSQENGAPQQPESSQPFDSRYHHLYFMPFSGLMTQECWSLINNVCWCKTVLKLTQLPSGSSERPQPRPLVVSPSALLSLIRSSPFFITAFSIPHHHPSSFSIFSFSIPHHHPPLLHHLLHPSSLPLWWVALPNPDIPNEPAQRHQPSTSLHMM